MVKTKARDRSRLREFMKKLALSVVIYQSISILSQGGLAVSLAPWGKIRNVRPPCKGYITLQKHEINTSRLWWPVKITARQVFQNTATNRKSIRALMQSCHLLFRLKGHSKWVFKSLTMPLTNVLKGNFPKFHLHQRRKAGNIWMDIIPRRKIQE